MATASSSVQELIGAHKNRVKEGGDYVELRKAFEADQNGAIEEIYSSPFVFAGIVLLRVRRGRILGWPRREYRIKLSHYPVAPQFDELISLLQDEERRATVLLNGRRQEIITQHVFVAIVYLLNVLRVGDDTLGSNQRKTWNSFLIRSADNLRLLTQILSRRRRVPTAVESSPVDAFGTKSTTDSDLLSATFEERISTAVKSGQGALARIRELVNASARQSALLLYLLGLFAGVIFSGLLVLIFYILATRYSTRDHDTNIIVNVMSFCLASGAVGATVSAMARITNDRTLYVAIEQKAVVTLLAGSFRPIVGSIIGVVFYILTHGGLLPLKPLTKDAESFFYIGLAFLAGFSERWAQDTIVSSTPKLKSTHARREKISPAEEEGTDTDTPLAIHAERNCRAPRSKIQ